MRLRVITTEGTEDHRGLIHILKTLYYSSVILCCPKTLVQIEAFAYTPAGVEYTALARCRCLGLGDYEKVEPTFRERGTSEHSVASKCIYDRTVFALSFAFRSASFRKSAALWPLRAVPSIEGVDAP